MSELALELLGATVRPNTIMKTTRMLLGAMLCLATTGAMFAADAGVKTDARVEVTFFQPEKFMDVRDAYIPSEKGRDAILEQLRDYIVIRAKLFVPEGQKLSITFTDIDLAGEFEGWRGPEFMDVRIVKDIYSPKMNLEFKLTSADGTVLKEGKRQLRDLAFMMKISIKRDDERRFEKALLDDWLEHDFPLVKSG